MSQKSQVKQNLVFQGWAKLVSWLQSDWIPHGVSLEHPQAALASENITQINWNTPSDTQKLKRHNQIPTDSAKCLQTFSPPLKNAWLSQTGANPPFWQNGERQEFFHLTLLRPQNIKTSLSTTSKNDWVWPFFLFFMSVREKLQFTVSLDHPVDYAHFTFFITVLPLSISSDFGSEVYPWSESLS